jgi:23S rRNA (pseudouridine1915-N3)-methyltransferase
MKFSEIGKEQWAELQPYLDTCLLPITGLTGAEAPWEAAERLEELRDALDLIEIPYYGRVVTYPAVQYVPGQACGQLLENVCSALKSAGFRHVVAITAAASVSGMLPAAADLQLYVDPDSLRASPDDVKRAVTAQIQSLWNREDG